MRFSAATALIALFSPLVSALGSKCDGKAITGGTKSSSAPSWISSIPSRGTSPFAPNADVYKVRKNVKDYGAKGDGKTDDTAAINAALYDQGRCGQGCQGSALTPLLLYFPSGTYRISGPIQMLYYTVILGNPANPPTIIASANFTGPALIDGNPNYYYVNQNNFYRSIRNFVVDMREIPTATTMNAIHWQVSQATSIYNVRIEMSRLPNTGHVGIWMENGSGGFLGDIIINGGAVGLNMGNQQFTVRNVQINYAQVGVYMHWNWIWLFYQMTISDCTVAFRIQTGSTAASQAAGATIIADSTIVRTGTFVQTTTNQPGSIKGSIMMDNIVLTNVTTYMSDMKGNTALAGNAATQKTLVQFVQGTVYSGSSTTGKYVRAAQSSVSKPAALLENGRFVSRTRPSYANYDVNQFISVKAQGAVGDGVTDDTAALQKVLDEYAGCRVIFVDAGVYKITKTLEIPAGTQMTGEAWSTIMGAGSYFADATNPKVVVRVGAAGSTGIVEISDILFQTVGPAPGAIVLEWNVHDPSGKKGVAGMWDSIIRLGGARGTNLELAQCTTTSYNAGCVAAFMGLHITKQASAYIEGLWVWTADHDLEIGTQSNIFTARGIYSESQGPVWLVGTGSEHNVMYQYNLVGAANHWLGIIQTESPYFQPKPVAPAPFTRSSAWNDPTTFPESGHSWSVRMQNSKNILIYGAGTYSFFKNYNQDCVQTANCQTQVIDIDSNSTAISIFGLSTVGVENMLSINSKSIIPQSPNRSGLQSTVMRWTK
ncbi:glucan 1,3-beta-glucosidase [Auriculariales sp. MPI-PUGE-AT-0066]|nr:glucan 1,3-beta-glucosidase [Auriculariales sp. MPI-PUGE-AT-0066]